MHIDATLLAYARAHLLRVNGAAGPDQVEAFLASSAFLHLAGGFTRVLDQAMHDYIAHPGAEPVPPATADALLPLPFKNLSAPPVPELVAPASLFMHDVGFRLPDARAGEAYRQPLEAVPVSEDKVCFCALASDPDLVLAVENATGLVTGTPAIPGEHVLTVTYHYASEPGQLRHAAVRLTVNPGPP